MPFKGFQSNVNMYVTYVDKCPYMFIQTNVTISEDCANGQDTNYELTYTADSGAPITTCILDGTECSNGTCSYVLQNNSTDSKCQPPMSQFSGEDVTVSVTARNEVGRSNPSVLRNIGEFLVTSFHCSNH